MPTFDLISDVHTDVGDPLQHPTIVSWPDPSLTAERYLLLPGDLGRIRQPGWREWLRAAAARYKYTFVVLGNHEYYEPERHPETMVHLEKLARDYIKEIPRCVMLQENRVQIEDVTIIGCTLWTQLGYGNPHLHKLLAYMNDFQCIYTGKPKLHLLTLEEHTEMHLKQWRWLRACLDVVRPRQKILVMTHHAPDPACQRNPKHVNSPMSAAYINHGLDLSGANVWVYGHIHERHDQVVNGVRLITNCAGYHHERDGHSAKVYTFTM